MEISDYGLRRIIAVRDPAAVVDNFKVSMLYLLARPLGLRMCPQFPRYSNPSRNEPCANLLSNNMLPMGSMPSLDLHLGGCVEYQSAQQLYQRGRRGGWTITVTAPAKALVLSLRISERRRRAASSLIVQPRGSTIGIPWTRRQSSDMRSVIVVRQPETIAGMVSPWISA